MSLDQLEKWVRGIGAVALGVATVGVGSGLWRGMRRPKGRSTQGMPALARAVQRGSPPFYLLGSAAAVGMFRWLWRPVWPSLSPPARLAALIVGSLLYFPGLALLLWGRLALGEMYNVSSVFGAQLYANHWLVTTGPYACVRHPMYLGGLLAELGALLLYRTRAVLFILLDVPILLVRARREEELLAAEFGAEWEEYRRRVPAWVPRGNCCGCERGRRTGSTACACDSGRQS